MFIKIETMGIKSCYKNHNIYSNNYGPRFLSSRYKTYDIDGKLHNTLGPAVVCFSNYILNEYWLNGKQYSHKEWLLEIDRINKLK